MRLIDGNVLLKETLQRPTSSIPRGAVIIHDVPESKRVKYCARQNRPIMLHILQQLQYIYVKSLSDVVPLF